MQSTINRGPDLACRSREVRVTRHRGNAGDDEAECTGTHKGLSVNGDSIAPRFHKRQQLSRLGLVTDENGGSAHVRQTLQQARLVIEQCEGLIQSITGIVDTAHLPPPPPAITSVVAPAIVETVAEPPPPPA